tara:strand:+ start:1178 stop:2260 length:1083 start_codon:yes stop_codon:yes gene_type:complete
MKIIHIGSYDRNFGDNVALLNVRKEFDKQIDNIEWVDLDIQHNFWAHKNNIKRTIGFFNSVKPDAIVVGGGGLIEYEGYSYHETHFKLPFNREILKTLECPTFFVGLGINYFRGKEGFSDEAKVALNEVIEDSTCFSLRNDGSMDILDDLGLLENNVDKVTEIPDPGLIFDFQKDRKFTFSEVYFQPAFNTPGKGTNSARFVNKKNQDNIKDFCKEHNLISIPHTPKDFLWDTGREVLSKTHIEHAKKFENTEEFIKFYLQLDFGVSMRGHGQLVSIGLNIPGLYFSTQDKVKYFSLKNGFDDYNIDVMDEDFYNKLVNKYKLMLSDKEYINNWYDIRDKNIIKWKEQFSDFVKKCKSKI